MRLKGRRVIMAAIALIGIGALIFGSALVVSGFNPLELSRRVSGYEQRYADLVGTFSRISIDDVDANIRILPAENGKCRVIYDQTERSSYHIGIEDGALIIEHNRSWLDSFGIIMSAPKLTVYLPEAEYKSLSVHAVSGSVQADGLDVKRAELELTSGSIQLNNMRIEGEAALKTISGSIELEGLRAGSLSARTTSGAIRLNGVDAEALELHSTSGSIRGELLSGKVFEASSVSGRISVPESQPGAGICSASTTSGRITISVAE